MRPTIFPRQRPLLLAALALSAVLVLGLLAIAGVTPTLQEAGAALLVGMAIGAPFQLRDTALKITKALSNGAGSVNSDPFDLGHSANGANVAPVELLITAPALTTTQLPDTNTMTYVLEHSADNSSYSTVHNAVLVQTGAGGAGAAAATKRVRLPSDVSRYVRVKATKTGTGDASTVSMTLEQLF